MPCESRLWVCLGGGCSSQEVNDRALPGAGAADHRDMQRQSGMFFKVGSEAIPTDTAPEPDFASLSGQFRPSPAMLLQPTEIAGKLANQCLTLAVIHRPARKTLISIASRGFQAKSVSNHSVRLS